MQISFILLALVSAGVVFASETPADCDTPVDLRNSGESMDGLGMTTQGYESNNLCGFFAYSTYLDAYRISHTGESGRTIVRSSPIAVGVDNAIRSKIPYWFPLQNSTDPLALRPGRWGATFCALANSVKKIGYCLDEALPTATADETAKFSDITTFFYEHLLSIAEAPATARKRIIDERLGPMYAKYLGWATERGSVLLSQPEVRTLIEKTPTIPYLAIRSIFFPKCALSSNRRNDFNYNSCKSELYLGLDVTGIPTRSRDPLRSERALKRVIDLLERPRALPVPFAYCSSVLRAGKRYIGASPALKDCWIHWSLVVGRRRIGNDCYMLVHNSWRPNSTYSKDWMVDGEDIWVREKELTRSMLMIQWLED